jgi:hypothetical protein
MAKQLERGRREAKEKEARMQALLGEALERHAFHFVQPDSVSNEADWSSPPPTPFLDRASGTLSSLLASGSWKS